MKPRQVKLPVKVSIERLEAYRAEAARRGQSVSDFVRDSCDGQLKQRVLRSLADEAKPGRPKAAGVEG